MDLSVRNRDSREVAEHEQLYWFDSLFRSRYKELELSNHPLLLLGLRFQDNRE